MEGLLQGYVALVHAFDKVAHDLLLALGKGGVVLAAEEPLPKGSSPTHLLLLLRPLLAALAAPIGKP